MQTSAHDVRIEAQSLRTSRQQLAVRTNNNDYCVDTPLDEYDAEVCVTSVSNSCRVEQELQEMRLYISGLDSTTKAAKTVVIFLTQRYVICFMTSSIIERLAAPEGVKLPKTQTKLNIAPFLTTLCQICLRSCSGRNGRQQVCS